MTGGCASMFFMKSCVILSSSSTSFMLRGAPPPTLPGAEGVVEGGLFIGWLKDAGGGVTVLVGAALGAGAAAWFALG